MTDSDITRLRGEFQQELARVSSEPDLQAIRDKYQAGTTPEQKKQMFGEMRAVRDEFDG